MKPISEYCRQEVLGWINFPYTMADPGMEAYSCSFYRQDGVQLLASVRKYGQLEVIHATIAPVKSVQDLSEEELITYILEQTPEILESFFPGRVFTRQPDDARRPQAKHYFSFLG